MLQELGLLSSHSMPCFPEKWNDRSSLWQTFGESVPKSDVKKRQEKKEHSNQQRERERERWKDRTDKMEFTIQKSILYQTVPQRGLPQLSCPLFLFTLNHSLLIYPPNTVWYDSEKKHRIPTNVRRARAIYRQNRRTAHIFGLSAGSKP